MQIRETFYNSFERSFQKKLDTLLANLEVDGGAMVKGSKYTKGRSTDKERRR
jgi:hypothetical protein